MKTITVPNNLVHEDELVVIPRRDYEQLISDSSKGIAKRDPGIDCELAISMREFREGKVEGPFDNVDDFMAFLRKKSRRSKDK